jgi:hypothetical protein
VRGRLPEHRHSVAALDGHVETHAADGELHLGAELRAARDLGRTRNEHAQCQSPADDHLFDVEEIDAVLGQNFEEGRRDTRLIAAGHSDQQRRTMTRRAERISRRLRCPHPRVCRLDDLISYGLLRRRAG